MMPSTRQVASAPQPTARTNRRVGHVIGGATLFVLSESECMASFRNSGQRAELALSDAEACGLFIGGDRWLTGGATAAALVV